MTDEQKTRKLHHSYASPSTTWTTIKCSWNYCSVCASIRAPFEWMKNILMGIHSQQGPKDLNQLECDSKYWLQYTTTQKTKAHANNTLHFIVGKYDVREEGLPNAQLLCFSLDMIKRGIRPERKRKIICISQLVLAIKITRLNCFILHTKSSRLSFLSYLLPLKPVTKWTCDQLLPRVVLPNA